MLIPWREKVLAIRAVIGPLLLSLAVELGPDPNSGPSCPTPSPLDLALAPPADEVAVSHP